MSKNIIYGLIDPTTKEIRYIGQSSTGLRRPKSHLNPSGIRPYGGNKNLNKKQAWVKSLLNKNIKPDIITIETLDSKDQLNEAEEFWITYFRSIGSRLTNGVFLSVDQYERVPWNKGKKNDPRSKGGVKKGNTPWNKGLTKKPLNKKAKPIPWNKGLSFKNLGICNRCLKSKLPEEFSTRGSKCKSCVAEAARLQRKRRLEKLAEDKQ